MPVVVRTAKMAVAPIRVFIIDSPLVIAPPERIRTVNAADD